VSCRKPPGALYAESGKEGVFSFRLSGVDGQALCEAAARRVRRHRGPGKISRRPRMQPANEEFFTLFSEAGSNIVESVAIPLAARSGSVIAAVAV
jgi:hypothetical protein